VIRRAAAVATFALFLTSSPIVAAGWGLSFAIAAAWWRRASRAAS
jgi:hypothetical protein